MANYSNIKKTESMQSYLTITMEGTQNLEKQEDIEGCSEKSKEVRKKDSKEV